MKQLSFVLMYLISPVIPSIFFFTSMGGSVDGYTLSGIFGVYAFILLCNQLILASRPKFAVKALGIKGLLALHSIAPMFILSLAIAHRMLKGEYGFDLGSTQATIGVIVLFVLFFASIAAFLLMANVQPPLGTKLRALRAWVEKTFKVGYKTSRAFHGITLLALVTLAVHVSLASSASLSSNLFGMAWLGAWLLVSLAIFIRYRVRGRLTPKA